jgi:hypothetical protein
MIVLSFPLPSDAEAFDPDSIRILSDAFEDAWQPRFEKSRRGLFNWGTFCPLAHYLFRQNSGLRDLYKQFPVIDHVAESE